MLPEHGAYLQILEDRRCIQSQRMLRLRLLVLMRRRVRVILHRLTNAAARVRKRSHDQPMIQNVRCDNPGRSGKLHFFIAVRRIFFECGERRKIDSAIQRAASETETRDKRHVQQSPEYSEHAIPIIQVN